MKAPNVYIGTVGQVDWKTDPSPDDDEAPDATPKEVVQILGFDPDEEFEDEEQGQ